jgi:uncharacterized damage-inducible protein DinB
MDAQHLIRFFDIHQWIFAQHAAGITHEESCRTFAGGGNSLNWVLGHIAVSRDNALALLDEPRLWTPQETAPYAQGGAGPAGPADARALSEILAALERSHAILKGRLETTSAADLDRPLEKETLGARLAFLQFHESYHAGQVGLLRRLLGKEGVIR